MQGWFSSFRAWEGGPTLYMEHRRTSATTDFTIITIIVAFFTIFSAFVTVLPGIRKQRIASLCTVSLSLLSGLTILLSKYGSCWHVGQGEINTSYKAFSNHKINASIGISIGLHHMNVTLQHMNVTLQVMPSEGPLVDINFNERFVWDKPTDMKDQYRSALVKGLPYPILTVAEYFSMNIENIGWGFHYREAGYYANITLTAAFVSWILMNVMLVNIPRYGGYLMVLTGTLLCLSTVIYWLLMPSHPLLIRFEDTLISFHLGWCPWLAIVIGVLQAVTGLVISLLDLIFPHTFSTIMDVDFDTPFDRHILIQDSAETRKRAIALKIPNVQKSIRQRLTSGSRYLRRLSTKKQPLHSMKSVPTGFYNHGFELTPATKSNSTGSPTKSVNFLADVPEISIDIHQDDDMLKKDTNMLDSLSGTNDVDDLYTDGHNQHKIASESAASAASGSSGISSASAATARSLSSNTSSSSVSLDEVEVKDTISKCNDNSENELDIESEDENVNVIKIHQTDDRGRIVYNKQNNRETINITWQEELILDNETMGINDSENEDDYETIKL